MAVGEWQQHAPRTGVHNRRTSWGRGARSAVGSVRGHRPCRAYPRGSLLEEYAHSQESMWGFLWVVVARQAHSAPHFSFTPRLARRTRSKAWVRARCSAAVKRGDVPHFGVDSQCRGGRTSWDGSRGGAAQTGGEDRGPPMNTRTWLPLVLVAATCAAPFRSQRLDRINARGRRAGRFYAPGAPGGGRSPVPIKAGSNGFP